MAIALSYPAAAPPAKRKNAMALAWTIGLHTLLLLILLMIKYGPPVHQEAPAEAGMEVNLGTAENGFGTDQPEDPGDPAPAAASAAAASMPDDDAIRMDENNDDADAPVVKTKLVPAKNTLASNTPAKLAATAAASAAKTAQAQPQQPRYTYTGATGSGGNGAQNTKPGSGEGNTTGGGDRGVPGGTAGAPNYTGNPGKGNGGISYNLKNRSIVAKPPMEAEYRMGGTVVIHVTVNRDGNIVNKRVVSFTNNELRGIAMQKVSGVRFSKSEEAPVEQFGNITIVFKARQ